MNDNLINDYNFMSKDDWNVFMKEDEANEHLGYISATQGFILKLVNALKIEDTNLFRKSIDDLVQNRIDLVEHACKAIDSRNKLNNSPS